MMGKIDSVEIPIGRPVYKDDIQIEMGAFMGPQRGGYRYWNDEYGKHPEDPEDGWTDCITEKHLKDYMDCGFTFAYLEEDGWYDWDHLARKYVTAFEESDL